jgi:hypothetical protein
MISLSLSKFLSLSPSFDDDEKIPRRRKAAGARSSSHSFWSTEKNSR